MMADLGVVLAIETHFEFTSFELVRILERVGAEPGGSLGICLDTMNLLTMLEEPVAATRRLLPWVVATHLKDGGVLASPEGLTTFPVAIGDGVIDLPGILALVDSLPGPVNLTIEDHGGSFALPIHDQRFLSGFPDLAPDELSALVRLAETARTRRLCRPIGRDEWAAICEDRLSRDLAAAERLVGSARTGPLVRAGGAES
jgi:sugar phosphate isomerase/epimerase